MNQFHYRQLIRSLALEEAKFQRDDLIARAIDTRLPDPSLCQNTLNELVEFAHKNEDVILAHDPHCAANAHPNPKPPYQAFLSSVVKEFRSISSRINRDFSKYKSDKMAGVVVDRALRDKKGAFERFARDGTEYPISAKKRAENERDAEMARCILNGQSVASIAS